MRRSIGWLVVAAAIAAAPAAAAAQPDDGLAWSADDRCGSLVALRERIALHLGRPLAASDAIRADVEVIRTPIEGDVRATVRIATRRGRTAREVHGADCTAVVDAVAFVLASAVAEELEPAEPPPRPVPDDVREDPTPRVGASRPEPSPWPAARDRLSMVLGFELWSDEGTLPARQLGLGGSLAASRGHYRGELGAAIWSGSWDPLGESGGATGVTLRSLSFRGCRAIRMLWLCAGLLQGTIHGGSGPDALPERGWTAVSFQTVWSRSVVGPVRVAASIEGVANLVRPGFYPREDRIEARSQWFALRLGLGLGVVLW